MITSRSSRLFVITICLVSTYFQQVMGLDDGKSRSSAGTSPNAKSRIMSHGDVQAQSISSSSYRITTEQKNERDSKWFDIPDWFFVVLLVVLCLFKMVQYDELKKSSTAKLQDMVEEKQNYKLAVDQQNSLLQSHVQSLVQEIIHLKADLNAFSLHSNSLDFHLDRDAAKATGLVRQVPASRKMQSQKCAAQAAGPVSKVPADNLSKQKLARMASGPVRQVPPAQKGSCVPEQHEAVAFMAAVVSTSEVAAKKAMRNGNGFQTEQNLVTKKVSKHGGFISKEENRSGRPVPGSSSFVRPNRIDASTAQVKKLLSGDYLTFYMGNLSYRANDEKLKSAIENRFPITVDQAVVAYSSDGRSRGCAFVTVRWKEFLNSYSDPKSHNLVQQFCDSLTGKPLFGRPVFVELACSQRRGG